jgi:hypothetical protein
VIVFGQNWMRVRTSVVSPGAACGAGAAGVVALGGFLSLLIPNIGPLDDGTGGAAEGAVSAFESIDVA